MKILEELNLLANNAGKPEEDLTIMAEGNAAVFDQASGKFLVKASGVVMGEAKLEDWVWLELQPCVDILKAAAQKGASAELTDELNKILKTTLKKDMLIFKFKNLQNIFHLCSVLSCF